MNKILWHNSRWPMLQIKVYEYFWVAYCLKCDGQILKLFSSISISFLFLKFWNYIQLGIYVDSNIKTRWRCQTKEEQTTRIVTPNTDVCVHITGVIFFTLKDLWRQTPTPAYSSEYSKVMMWKRHNTQGQALSR